MNYATQKLPSDIGGGEEKWLGWSVSLQNTPGAYHCLLYIRHCMELFSSNLTKGHLL